MPDTLSVRHESARRSDRDRWVGGSTTSSTTSRPKGTRPAYTASRQSRGDLRCVARAAAGRGNRDRRAPRRPLYPRVAALAAAKRGQDRGLGSAGGVRLLAAHLWTRGVAPRPGPLDARCVAEQWLQCFDDHLVQVHAWPSGPDGCTGAMRPRSCRVRGDTDARLVPAHGADDRGIRADPGQPALPVVVPRPGQCHPCIPSLPCLPRCGPRRHRGRRAGHTRMEARQTARALADDDVQRVLAAVDQTRPAAS